jgi:hypothetical protein
MTEDIAKVILRTVAVLALASLLLLPVCFVIVVVHLILKSW